MSYRIHATFGFVIKRGRASFRTTKVAKESQLTIQPRENLPQKRGLNWNLLN